ncbi:Putative outer membrane protein [gamma proteobacterium HdN1]|nr:Putative outer membrane protein [gamma proteobacterium HdN1]
MNKSMIVGSVLGASVAVAGGAIAGFSMMNQEPKAAQVLGVEPIIQIVKTPREECKDRLVKTPRQECNAVNVTHQRPVQDSNRIVGSIVGAAIGGALGNQVGGGNGKKAATIAGVAAGGYVGNQVQKGMQQRDTYTTTEQHCKTVYDSHTEKECTTVYDESESTVGYNVSYQLGDTMGKVKMDHNPGAFIPVKDGLLVLDSKVAVPDVQPIQTAGAKAAAATSATPSNGG